MGLKSWIEGICRGGRSFARRAVGDARGNVAMLFALSLPVLILMTFGGLDLHRLSTVRMNLQDALDAATLAAARSPYTTDADLKRVGLAALKANLQAYPDVTLEEDLTTFTVQDEVVIADARVQVKTLVANIFLPPYGQLMDEHMPVASHSEVDRSSRNIEVALVLDVTGSMAGSRITALKAAAIRLIQMVVQDPDQQTPYYSKVAIVPYSIGVNAGGYANAVRGAPTQSTSITAASWMVAGSQKTISAVSKANPGVLTASAHGYSTDDYIWISGIADQGGTGTDLAGLLNSRPYKVVKIDNNTFSIQRLVNGTWTAVSTSNTETYTANSGIARRCRVSDCSVVVTSAGHGLSNGEGVYITDVRGMTQINTRPYLVGNVTSDTFSIGVNGADWGTYTSGGAAWCGRDGCQWRVFTSQSGVLRASEISTCISDRAGDNAYTDAAPGTGSWLGRLYPTQDSCSSRVVTPLSDQRQSLIDEIGLLQPTGSTAGQIGLTWGWYALSDRFSGVWGSGRTGGPNDPEDTLKAIVLMTDGEFNTTYCQGVLAADANYGSNSTQINCDASNGNPFQQTAAMCDRIKDVRRPGDDASDAPAIIIYAVGLSVSTSLGGDGIDTAREVLEHCASGAARAKFATSSAELTNAFEEFARDMTLLRLAK